MAYNPPATLTDTWQKIESSSDPEKMIAEIVAGVFAYLVAQQGPQQAAETFSAYATEVMRAASQ